ncbi:glycosyltransferase family 1 protein [Meiothermus sp. QL-1]|nr:glycosyltransferase family 4 protein [Meiothermus sp. QL-1]RDI96248.1 glycosyltransferase family 1 protein [Meiothermus sp. QL-1]
MRVLHIIEATGAGTARHVSDLCLGLAERGVEVHLAYSPLRLDHVLTQALPRLQQAGVRHIAIPMRRSPHPSDLAVLFRLHRYMADHGPFDLIHGHSSKGGALARLLAWLEKRAVIYTPNAFSTLSKNLSRTQKLLYESAEKVLARTTTALIAVSKSEAVEAQRLGIPAERIKLITNAIQINSGIPKKKSEVRKKLGLSCEHIVIGFVGRFVPQKAPFILIDAFARISTDYSQARLVMVGEGPLRPRMELRIKQLGVAGKVILPGPLEGRWAMQGFDIFALPSDYEGFPYVLLEAMAERLPIVATRVGGAEQAIAEGVNGFLVPTRSTVDFASALSRLLADEKLRKQMGEQSYKRVQAYSVDKMVDATLALYHELLGR